MRDQGHHRLPARVQPDDGSPRLPSGVTYPEIAKMQTRAVIRAAINVKKAHPDWNIARDHDPAGRRGEGAEVRQEDVVERPLTS